MLDTTALAELGAQLAAHGECWLVGGCVRDLVRGQPVKDVDFVVRGSTMAAGRALARRFAGHVFWLREEEEVVRVLLPQWSALQLDLCPLRGPIEADLAARDLTVNALGLPADAGGDLSRVLDVTGGLQDLAAGVLRFVSPEAPVRDPLRTLRVVRFRWKLGFDYAPGTIERVRECLPLLANVSAERIRDELFQLLALAQPADALAELLDLGFARYLFGREAPLPHVNGESISVRDVRLLAERLNAATGDLATLMAAIPTVPRTRREVALWAAALRSLAPALDPAAAARALALSSEERTLIAKGITHSAKAADLIAAWRTEGPVSGKERYRFLKAASPAGPEAVLLNPVSDPAEALLAEALERQLRPQPPLVTGHEVMKLLGLSPGPSVGKALEGVEEARADGLITTREEALSWLLRNATAGAAAR